MFYNIAQLILFRQTIHEMKRFRFDGNGLDFKDAELPTRVIEKLDTINQIITKIDTLQLSPHLNLKKQLSIRLTRGRYGLLGVPVPPDFFYRKEFEIVVDLDLLLDEDFSVNEWKSVFAHEIGHLVLNHHINFKVLLYQFLPFLSQINEYQADAFSFQIHQSCHDLINFVDKLENKIRILEEKNNPVMKKIADIEPYLLQWFSSHPSLADRKHAFFSQKACLKEEHNHHHLL
jgi:hypothetical protein